MSEEIKINNQALDDFLHGDLGEFLATTKNIDETVKTIQIAKESGLPTPEGVTLALEGFLEKGASVLDTMAIYCNNMPDSESVNSFASLMNALSRAINNIATLYKNEQSHRNRLELEDKKHEYKMKEIEFRERLKATNKNLETGEGTLEGLEEAEVMVEVSTSDIIEQYIKVKNN